MKKTLAEHESWYIVYYRERLKQVSDPAYRSVIERRIAGHEAMVVSLANRIIREKYK